METTESISWICHLLQHLSNVRLTSFSSKVRGARNWPRWVKERKEKFPVPELMSTPHPTSRVSSKPWILSPQPEEDTCSVLGGENANDLSCSVWTMVWMFSWTKGHYHVFSDLFQGNQETSSLHSLNSHSICIIWWELSDTSLVGEVQNMELWGTAEVLAQSLHRELADPLSLLAPLHSHSVSKHHG